MLNSTTWLNALRAASSARSDYQLAKKLGVTQSAVSRWSTGANGFGPEIAPLVAEFIQVPESLAILAASYWKAKTEAERRAFQAAYTMLGGVKADEKIEELSAKVQVVTVQQERWAA